MLDKLNPIVFVGRKLSFDDNERASFRLLAFAAVFAGGMSSIWVIFPELARNALHASETHISILALLWPIAQTFAPYWSSYMDGHRNKGPVLVRAGMIARLPLAFGAFFSNILFILPFFTLFIAIFPAVIAMQHTIIQTNFKKAVRGKVFSYVLSTNLIVSTLMVGLWGLILDDNEQHYRWIIIFASVSGVLETYFLSKAKLTEYRSAVFLKEKLKRPLKEKIIKPWREVVRLYSEDRAFFRYEMNFFIYGLGFMILQPAIVIFLVNDLSLSYTQISLAKGVILQTGVILMTPIMGAVFDRINPMLFASRIFLWIVILPLGLITIGLIQPESPHWYVYFAYGLWSLGWAGMALVWNLGSMFFAGAKDVSRYSGTHVLMVGLRGIVALPISILLLNFFPAIVSFVATGILWLLAAFAMWRQWKSGYQDKPGVPVENPGEALEVKKIYH